jgi:hypothetical protein
MSGFNLEKGADRRRGLRASDTPDKGRMTRPLNKTQQAQAEGAGRVGKFSTIFWSA